MPRKDLTGKQFGELAVKQYAGSRNGRGALWECLCSCGNQVVVRGDRLRTGKTKSCGHLFDKTIANTAKKGRKSIEDSAVDGVELARYTDRASKNNSTGYRGVSKYRGKYRARITVNGKEYTKTGFKTPEDAYYNGRLKLEKEYLPKDNK